MPHSQDRPDGRTVAGRYRLLSELGRGGTGVVWRAEDLLLGRTVAVKEVLLPLLAPRGEQDLLRERTLREARAAARLRDPGIVTVFDVVSEQDRPFIVMELVHGRTLAEAVTEDGPLHVEAAAASGLAVLHALAHAHAAGVVHRDVKPSNVLLADDRRVVLTDWGIAQSSGDASLTSTGLLVGSPAYVAPERIAGAPAGPAADLWGLGATLFLAVEGRPAYDRGEAMPTLMAVAADDRSRTRLAGALAPVLARLLEPDPARRAGAREAEMLLRRAVSTTRDRERGAAGDVTGQLARPGVDARARGGALPPPVPPAPPVPPRRPAPRPAEPVTRPHQPAAPVARQVPVAEPKSQGRVVRPRHRGRRVGIAGAAGVAGVAVVGGALFLAQQTGGSTTAAGQGPRPTPGAAPRPVSGGPASSVAAPASPPTSIASHAGAAVTTTSPTPSAPSRRPGAVPADWQPRTSPDGWTITLPSSWSTRSSPQGQTFSDPVTGAAIQVAYQPVAAGDPVADWQQKSRASDIQSRLPGYATVSIQPVDYRGYTAADWQFTYDGRRGLNRGFIANGHGQALFLSAPADRYDEARALFEKVAAGFQPVP